MGTALSESTANASTMIDMESHDTGVMFTMSALGTFQVSRRNQHPAFSNACNYLFEMPRGMEYRKGEKLRGMRLDLHS